MSSASAAAARLARFSAAPTANSFIAQLAARPALQSSYVAALKMADPALTYSIHDTVMLRAECESMCPAFEAEEREFGNSVDLFERRDGQRGVIDRALAVKKFKRSAAGDPPPLPCDVRPPPVLFVSLLSLLSCRPALYEPTHRWSIRSLGLLSASRLLIGPICRSSSTRQY